MKRKINYWTLYSAIAAMFFIGTTGCKKEANEETTPEIVNNGNLASLTTSTIGNITANSAAGGGSITSNGGTTITSRGVCWSINNFPTVEDFNTTSGSGNGFFTSDLNGLTTTTTYYVRAFAVNSAGTAYGNQVVFTTF